MDSSPRLTNRFIIGYNLLYLGVNYLWISFEALILPLQVSSVVNPAEMGIMLGMTASVGNAFGIFGNLFSGIFSDRIRFWKDKRSPYIIAGVTVVFFTLIGETIFTKSIYEVLAGYILLQAFSNLAIGATQPILAEIESREQRGTSAGINGLFSLIGSALGFGITSFFLASPLRNGDLYSIAAGIAITGAGTIFAIKNRRFVSLGSNLSRLRIRLARIRKIPINMRKFSRLIIGSFFVFSGITGLTYFELYFFKEILNVSDPATYVAIAGILVLAISAVSSIALGHFSNRIGRWNIVVADAAIASIPTLIIPYFRSFYIFLLLGSVIGATYGTFYSVSFAIAGDLVPEHESGKYMSIFYLALAGASTISPLIYGLMLFIFNQSSSSGFVALFTTSSLFYMLGAVVLYLASKS